MKPIASLFSTVGTQWGLRGDPHLWREMEQYFAATPLPETVNELPPLVKAAFETLTGHSFSFGKHFFVERFASGGMSSGYISTEFWQERAIPLLCDRYEKATIRRTTMLSINTDFSKSYGNPEPHLHKIAAAGFSHIHWVHHWKGDFMYSPSEIEQIGRWLKKYDLILSDLHATDGDEKFWLSTDEYARLAGVELVKNRLDMTAELGGNAIVMHIRPDGRRENPDADFWDRFQRSMDVILPYATERGVQIAFENLENKRPNNYVLLKRILTMYSPDQVGICYDSGHGNIVGGGLDFLDEVKDRLIVLHLNDNDGTGDQHKPLFAGTVDWERHGRLIAASSYQKPLSMELSIAESGFDYAEDFLDRAMVTGIKFAKMVENAK